mgnify:CR=1 FL=1
MDEEGERLAVGVVEPTFRDYQDGWYLYEVLYATVGESRAFVGCLCFAAQLFDLYVVSCVNGFYFVCGCFHLLAGSR